jgi:hypothetical protein
MHLHILHVLAYCGQYQVHTALRITLLSSCCTYIHRSVFAHWESVLEVGYELQSITEFTLFIVQDLQTEKQEYAHKHIKKKSHRCNTNYMRQSTEQKTVKEMENIAYCHNLFKMQ